MMTNPCPGCSEWARCCVHGKNTARQLREMIKRLRAALATVVACPRRKAWDAPPKGGRR